MNCRLCGRKGGSIAISWAIQLPSEACTPAIICAKRKCCVGNNVCACVYNTDSGVVGDQCRFQCIQEFNGHQWKVVDVKSDGDCMFSSLAHQSLVKSVTRMVTHTVQHLYVHSSSTTYAVIQAWQVHIMCLVNLWPTGYASYQSAYDFRELWSTQMAYAIEFMSFVIIYGGKVTVGKNEHVLKGKIVRRHGRI